MLFMQYELGVNVQQVIFTQRLFYEEESHIFCCLAGEDLRTAWQDFSKHFKVQFVGDCLIFVHTYWRSNHHLDASFI